MTTFARFLGVGTSLRGAKRRGNLKTKKRNKKTYNLIMNKELTTAATLSLGVRSYESPAVLSLEVISEGVLCQSGSFEEWGEEDLW